MFLLKGILERDLFGYVVVVVVQEFSSRHDIRFSEFSSRHSRTVDAQDEARLR